MRLIECTDLKTQLVDESVVTIGNFDGVHRGHTELFRRLKECGKNRSLPTVVVTFEPHPLSVLAPDVAPPMISTFEQKVELISRTGIDFLIVIRFTREFSTVSAEAFVRSFLCHSIGMRHILIGHDYGFGKDRLGNFDTLAGMSDECGFTMEDLDPVGVDGLIFSSSLVRRRIASGDMTGAAEILGRYHVITGRVVHGREIGSMIGFPTANLATENELIPPDGVYAVMVSVGNRLIQGACNIGKNPTFAGITRTIEVFLLDFSGQLYDQVMALSFVSKIRDVKKYPDAQALIDAITHDVATTRTILATSDAGMIVPITGMN